MSEKIILELFAVRNKEGKWFRAKGYGGYGDTWVDDITSARIYPKAGPAKARVTYFADNYPDYGIPDVVKLIVTDTEIMDQTERYQNQKKKKEIAAAKYAENQNKKRLKEARKQLKEAEERVRKVMKDV